MTRRLLKYIGFLLSLLAEFQSLTERARRDAASNPSLPSSSAMKYRSSQLGSMKWPADTESLGHRAALLRRTYSAKRIERRRNESKRISKRVLLMSTKFTMNWNCTDAWEPWQKLGSSMSNHLETAFFFFSLATLFLRPTVRPYYYSHSRIGYVWYRY